MPWLTDVANDLEDGASLLAEVLELDDLGGLEVTEDEAERIGIEFPAGYRYHSGFYATKSIAQAQEALAVFDVPAAAARRKAARRRAERDGAFALFDFDELWALAWAGFLLEHLRECKVLAGHAVIDFQDCLWGEDEASGSDCTEDIKAALGRYEGRLFEQPHGRRGYALLGAVEARVRRRRARKTLFDVLKSNLQLPNWTTLIIEVRTTQQSLRVELDEPLPQLRVLWVTKLLYAGESWVVLTAPATAGIQDPVVYQLLKDFCIWPPDRLYQWRPGVHIDVDDTDEPILLTRAVQPLHAALVLEELIEKWVPTPDRLTLHWELLGPRFPAASALVIRRVTSPQRQGRAALAHCLRPECGNPLSDPESIRRGYGPICWAKVTGEVTPHRLFTGSPSSWGAMGSVNVYSGDILRRFATFLKRSTVSFPASAGELNQILPSTQVSDRALLELRARLAELVT